MQQYAFDTVGTRRMAELINRYRLNAEKCLELARTFKEVESKRALVVMANAWLALAAQRSKNIEKRHSAPCPRCQSPMMWYHTELAEDRRTLVHNYQCAKCGLISRSDDQGHQVERQRSRR